MYQSTCWPREHSAPVAPLRSSCPVPFPTLNLSSSPVCHPPASDFHFSQALSWLFSPSLALPPLCSLLSSLFLSISFSSHGLVQSTAHVWSSFSPCPEPFQMPVALLSLTPAIKPFSSAMLWSDHVLTLHNMIKLRLKPKKHQLLARILMSVFVKSWFSSLFACNGLT